MTRSIRPAVNSPFLDKTEVQRIVAEQNALMGFVPDPNVTAAEARAMATVCLKTQGIRSEDNVGSRGIIAMREE